MSDGFKKILILIGIVIYMIGPLLLVAIAGNIASGLGCSLDEGSVSECLFMGTDIGDLLYMMFVCGWFSIATIPTGGFALIGFAIYLLASPVVSRSKSKKSKVASFTAGALLAVAIGSLWVWVNTDLGSHELETDTFYKNESDPTFIKVCAKGSVTKLRKYLADGSDPNVSGSQGMNPLLAAYLGRNLDGFHVLLENGADPNLIPTRGIDKHVAAYIMGNTTQDWRPDGIPYMKALFQHGLDPNLGDGSSRLIHFGATARMPEYLVILVENGAEINPDLKWRTPLALAMRDSRRWRNALYLLKQDGIGDLENAVTAFNQEIQSQSQTFALPPEEAAIRNQIVKELVRLGALPGANQ